LNLALITGASKGIGRSTAKVFANAGWDLILLGRDLSLMEELKSDLSSTGRKIFIVKCDLLNSQNIKIEIPKMLNNIGCPSVLINNAGFAINKDLMDTTIDEWQKLYPSQHKTKLLLTSGATILSAYIYFTYISPFIIF